LAHRPLTESQASRHTLAPVRHRENGVHAITVDDLRARREVVLQASPLTAVLAVVNDPATAVPTCPSRCGRRVHRWGRNGGVQRFRCTACGRSFNALTGTPLARLRRRDLWLDHARVLNDGLSIRAAGRRLGIHHNTTFRWRHRWLARPAALKDVAFQGIVEAMTVPFVDVRAGEQPWRRVAIPEAAASRAPPAAVASGESGELDGAPPGTAEGIRDWAPAVGRAPVVVLVARDRRGSTTDHLIDAFDEAAVAAVLAPLLAAGRTILCVPDSAVLAAVASDLGVPHRRCPAPTAGGCDGAPDLRHVRGYVDRLRCWMRRFRGVSTHHLGRYLGWRRLLDRHRPAVPPGLWLRLALGRHQALDQQATVAGGRSG
jgi:transposase-like protein